MRTPRSRIAGFRRPWRVLLDDGQRDPILNLARDEALARCAGPVPTLRLWCSERSVILGRSQIGRAEVDEAACREASIPVLRRFSGGGAVYHDPGNLNVTVVVDWEDPLIVCRPERRGLPGLFGLVLEPLAAAVRSLGVPAQVGDREVTVFGDKVSGVAGWLGARAVLVHATLLVDADLEALERVLDGPGAPGDPRWERTRSRRAPVTCLARVNPNVDFAALCQTIVDAFAAGDAVATAVPRSHRGERVVVPIANKWTSEELTLAARLAIERYGDPDWNATGTSRKEAMRTH